MSRGAAIIVNSDPKGNFDEGIITDTSKPGTFMEIVPGTAPSGTRFSWRARSSANGAKGPLVILLPNWEEGQLATTAYVANTRCKLYWVLPGDEVNALVSESSGTGTASQNAIGDQLSVNDSGMLIASTSTSSPFYLLDRTGIESYATALKWVKCIGLNA